MPQNALIRRLNRVQDNVADITVKELKTKGQALIVMPTGTGKTILGSKIFKLMPNWNILWITQMEELIFQTYEDFQQIFGEQNVGLFKRNVQEIDRRITVGSIQTIARYYKDIPKGHFDVIGVDEGHHSMAETWRAPIEYFNAKKLCLTATPDRADGLDIRDLFGPEIFKLSYQDAKKMRLIADETYRVILTNSQINGIVTRSGEYKPEDLDRLVVSENRNEIIVEAYKKYGRKFMDEMKLPRKAICFCIDVRHAMRMQELFQDHGIKAEALVSKHSSYWSTGHGNPLTEKERRETYAAFKHTNDIEILCAVGIMNEGKSVNDIGCLLLARPTRSSTIVCQQIGRGCRRIEGKKENFIILDFVDMMNQRFPPAGLGNVMGRRYEVEEIVPDFYSGKDPIVINEIIHYLSPDYEAPSSHWTKKKIGTSLTEFYNSKGAISSGDLAAEKTGLPSPGTIRRHWDSVKVA